MEPRRLVAAYFVTQALAVLAWWGLLMAYPLSVRWFQPADWPAEALISFWMADLFLIVVGSVITAIGVWFHHRWATTVVWSVATITWYPTLVCFATSLHTGEAWIASSMMIIMADLSIVMASIHGNTSQTPSTISTMVLPRFACPFVILILLAAPTPAAEPITSHENIEFATVASNAGPRTLKLDLYRPVDESVLPGIVLVHGGGWASGTKESFRPLAKELATDGYVVITIQYRLSGEAMFPGALEDCKLAIRWLRAHAQEYGVNSDRIGAVGGSAGGHLVGMVATTAGKYDVGEYRDQSSELQAAVLMGAGVDQVKRSDQAEKPIHNCVVFFGGTIAEKRDVYTEASPITHVSATTSPILFLDGEKDRPGERYVDIRPKMTNHGIVNELAIVPGAKHGQWNKQPFRQIFRDEIKKFFVKQLSE